MTHLKRRQAPLLCLALAALAAFLLVGTGPATADPSISSKRQQAQAILGQIQEMDSSLSHAIESYNLANIQLDQIDADLKSNGRHLVIARSSLGIAQTHIAKRLRALYINGDSGGAVEVILGARSLDDLLDRLDMAQAVGGQDAQVLQDVRRFRNEVETRRAKLKSDRARQAQVVADRAARKRSIESQLAERQRLLASVKDEIARMEAAERRRQAELERQARARLAAEAAARASARQQTLELSSSGTPATDYTPDVGVRLRDARASREVRRRRRDRDGVPRHPLRLGRREPVRLRLLGARDVRLRAGRDLAAAQRRDAVQHRRRARSRGASSSRATSSSSTGSATWGSTSAAASSSTRPTPGTSSRSRASTTPGTRRRTSARSASRDLLARQRSQGLNRALDHRLRRGTSLKALSAQLLERPRLASRRCRGSSRVQLGSLRDAVVEGVDLVREVLEDDPPLELERRRHLALLHLEVAREDREALDLLEA